MTLAPHGDRGETSRRSVLARLGGTIALGSIGLSSIGQAQASAVPAGPTFYDVTIEGQTRAGTFTRGGQLLVAPTLDRSGANFDNGVNPRDVGLVSGNPPGQPESGAIWYGTNTSIFDLMGLDTTIDASLVDTAIVAIDESSGGLAIEVDGQFFGLPAARSSVLNTFTPDGGLLAGIYQIIRGQMGLQFADGGATVQGAFSFVGNGYIEPGETGYEATISGAATG